MTINTNLDNKLEKLSSQLVTLESKLGFYKQILYKCFRHDVGGGNERVDDFIWQTKQFSGVIIFYARLKRGKRLKYKFVFNDVSLKCYFRLKDGWELITEICYEFGVTDEDSQTLEEERWEN